MFNVSKVFAKLFPCKKVQTNRAVVPQVVESKEDLKLDVLINFESVLKQRKADAVTKMVRLVEDGDLSKEEQFRDVAKVIGLDFEAFDCDDLNAFCAGVEWSNAWDDVYVKNYDVAFNKLIYIYEQVREGNVTCYPDVTYESDLADIICDKIRESYNLPDYLDDYINWDYFARDLVEDNGGEFTQYGYFQMLELDL